MSGKFILHEICGTEDCEHCEHFTFHTAGHWSSRKLCVISSTISMPHEDRWQLFPALFCGAIQPAMFPMFHSHELASFGCLLTTTTCPQKWQKDERKCLSNDLPFPDVCKVEVSPFKKIDAITYGVRLRLFLAMYTCKINGNTVWVDLLSAMYVAYPRSPEMTKVMIHVNLWVTQNNTQIFSW